jgi:hypothetical protein
MDSSRPNNTSQSTVEAQSLDQPLQNGSSQTLVADDFVAPPKSTFVSWLLRYRIILLAALLIIAGGLVLLSRNTQPVASTQAGDFDVIQANLKDIAPNLSAASSQFITINGQLQVASSIIISPSVQPESGIVGQLYFDQATNQLNYYNGDQFLPVGGNTTFIQNSTSILNGGDSITNVTNATAGITTTGGTTNALLKFTSAQTAADSIATDNGTFLGIAGGLNLFAGTTITEKTLFSPSTTPTIFDLSDTTPALELGVKFQVDVPGVVKGVRFYKSATQTGTFIGSLWTSGGTLLGQATFTVSASGWQQVTFSSPIPISTDTTYIASYNNVPSVPGSVLGYPYDAGRFGAGSIDNGPLHGIASGLDGGNGVFKYTATPAMPNQSFNSTSYYVDVIFAGSIYTDDSRIRINDTQISSSDLANDSNLAKRASSQVFSGHNIFRNGSDSADAFAIQKADTSALFTVDTLSSRVYIGPGTGSNPAVLLILGKQSIGAVNDPPGTDGAIYYSAALESFRCFQDNQWGECGDLTVTHGFSLYEEFLGGQTTSFGTNNIIGSLGWNTQAIGANGNINFNPTTPTPIADRPGVLVLQTPAVLNQGTTLMLANSNGASMLINKGNVLRASVAVGAASGLVLRVGLHNETNTTTQPVSGVWFEADPATNANWRYCYGNGTTATCTNTSVAITADTWVRMEIRVTAIGVGVSGVAFYLNGNNVANVTNVTIDSTNRVSPAYTLYSTNGSAQSSYWDYFQLKGTTSAAR